MAAKIEKSIVETPVEKPVTFTCRFCGETKPLSDMVIIRRFYPHLSACSNCALYRPVQDIDTPEAEEKAA
jgi:transcription elongation factor Elf1